MVRIKYINKEEKTYKYLVENTDYVTLNSVRRMLNYLLPIYGIEDIDFYENDSVVVDEMLANRIGLCPIKNPVLNTGKKVSFKLEEEGPKTVYSGDFISSDKDIDMAYKTIPLTKLNEKEKIKLEAYAVLGYGRDHFKFSPAIVSYSNLYELELGGSCSDCNFFFDKCLENAIDKIDTKKIVIDPDSYDFCNEQVEKCNKKCLKFNSTNNYLLRIELIGQTTGKDLFKLADRYLKEYFSVLKKKLK